MVKEKVKRRISIPFGGVFSFAIMIYMIQHGIWSELSLLLKILAVIGLILLFFMGEVEYERSETTGE